MNVRKQSRMYTIIAIPNRIAGTVHVNSNHVAHVWTETGIFKIKLLSI